MACDDELIQEMLVFHRCSRIPCHDEHSVLVRWKAPLVGACFVESEKSAYCHEAGRMRADPDQLAQMLAL